MGRGVTSFEVKLFHEGKTYVFYGDKISRNLADGGGNLILAASCYEVDSKGKILRRGVVNLSPEWTITHLFMD